MLDVPQILALLEAGNYWPALALLLIGATHLVRRAAVEQWLLRLRQSFGSDAPSGLGHLRGFLPLALAGAAWLICVLSPFDVNATEAAYTAVLSAFAAMGMHGTYKAFGASRHAVRAINPSKRDTMSDENQTDEETTKTGEELTGSHPPPPPPDKEGHPPPPPPDKE